MMMKTEEIGYKSICPFINFYPYLATLPFSSSSLPIRVHLLHHSPHSLSLPQDKKLADMEYWPIRYKNKVYIYFKDRDIHVPNHCCCIVGLAYMSF